MKISELSHVVIGTPDLGKWRDYGTKVLGMEAVDAPDGSLYLKMDSRDFRFLVQKSDKDELFASGWGVSGAAELAGAPEQPTNETHARASQRRIDGFSHALGVEATIACEHGMPEASPGRIAERSPSTDWVSGLRPLVRPGVVFNEERSRWPSSC